MAVQTSYPAVPAAVAYAGGIADNTPKTVLSRLNDAADDIPFGIAVAHKAAASGASPGTVDLPDNSADEIVGVVVRCDSFANQSLSGSDAHADGDVMSVLRQGRIYVATEDACVQGGAVYVRVGAGAGGTQLGAFRATDVAAETCLLANARWGSTQASAGGLAILEIDLNASGGAMS